MDITVGHVKNFFLGQHRQSYPTLNLKYQNPCMTTIYLDISESLGRREGKSSPEVLAGYQRWVKYADKIAAIQLVPVPAQTQSQDTVPNGTHERVTEESRTLSWSLPLED